MKKLLILILALVMCLSFTSCDTIQGLLGQIIPGFGQQDVDAESVIGGIYALYNTPTYKNAKADYTVENDADGIAIKWTSSTDVVKVVEANGKTTIDLPDSNDVELSYTLTATITVDGQDYSCTIKCTLPVYKEILPTVNTPEEGVAYKLSMYQNNTSVDQLLFATAEMDQDKYFKTSAVPSEALDFYVEVADGGYKFYYNDGSAKKYVEAYLVYDEANAKYSKRLRYSDNGTVWSYDAETKSWQTTLAQGEENVKYVLGTYNDFRTFCISEASFITADNSGVSQFPAALMLKTVADTIKPEHKCEHICVIEACGKCVDAECTEKACQDKCPGHSDLIPAADSTLTLEQAIAIGSAHIHNKYTEGKYYIVVTVEAITNETYGNMTVSNGTVSFTIYGTWSADGSLRYDAIENKPAVGDTVKLYGILGSYNKTAQMKNAWIVEVTKPEVEVHTCESKCQFCGKCTNTECTEEVCVNNQCPGCTAVVPPVSVTAPAVNTPYHFGLTQVTINKNLYITGNTANQTYYLATTENLEEAIEVKLEAVDGVEGAYRIYFVKDGVKTYIRIYERDAANKKGSLELVTETPVEYYTFDTTYNTLVLTSGANKYYLGAYRDFATLSVSSYDYISSNGNFATQFYAVAGSETTEHVCQHVCPECGKCTDTECTEEVCVNNQCPTHPAHVCAGGTATCEEKAVCAECGEEYGELADHKDDNGDYKCDTCSTKMLPEADSALTIEQAIAVAKVAGTTYTTNKYYITGTIKNVYNTTYGNMYIKDENGKELCIYGLYSADGKTRYDAMSYKPVKGDEITVYTVLGMYETTTQGKSAWLDEVVAHEHDWQDATCTAPKTCSICDATEGEPGDHVYVDGVCSCGKEEGAVALVNAKLDFSNKNNRTSFSSSKQVWEQNGVKLTNDKASSSNAVADYANPARFYQGSKITVEGTGITKVVITTSESKYTTALVNSAKTISGATVTNSGNVVTITFASAVDSFSFSCSAQIRMKTIVVN